MLAAGARVRRRDEFTAAMRGQRLREPGLIVHAATVGGAEEPKVGIITSKAVGTAVARNRVRRRLRHVMRPRLGDLPPGSLVVIRALPASAEMTSDRMAASVDSALSRLVATR